ncbi:hypothetical protein DSO57_1001279 [Entomophthora muscae]|uniref:Uncharacterized protein n=1 Tax=Entomophthora muscae TaxID=34485 RepID=A0ACC2T9B0_9FUNG|nr:hypothetical protein DSO57_1001279 [Entomophthora muscae]
MPPPAADMDDTMKKLLDTISSLHMYLASGDQPKSNQYYQNCKQYSHLTSYCKKNCNCCGEEGHPFIYCPTLCAPEAKASNSEAKSPKTKSSKPTKEANASLAKEETYLVESLAAVRSNVAQKHCLSQIVHPYSTPGKTKESELSKLNQPIMRILQLMISHNNRIRIMCHNRHLQLNLMGFPWMKKMALTMRSLPLRYKSLLLSRLKVRSPSRPRSPSLNLLFPYL